MQSSSHRPSGAVVGSTVALSFALVYLLVNGAVLPDPWPWVTRGLAAATLVGFVLLILRRRGRTGGPSEGAKPFGGFYGWTVLAEVALIFGGLALMRQWGLSWAGVAWVTTVVGLHWFPLAWGSGERFFHVLGVLMTALGVGALAWAATGATPAQVALVGGVLPGLLLSAFALWGVSRSAPTAGRREAAA